MVTRGPSSTLAPSAFIELGLAVSLFEKAQAHPAVKQGLVTLCVVQEAKPTGNPIDDLENPALVTYEAGCEFCMVIQWRNMSIECLHRPISTIAFSSLRFDAQKSFKQRKVDGPHQTLLVLGTTEVPVVRA